MLEQLAAPVRRYDARRVKARIDIVELVGRHVALRRSGRGYVGLCPFHQEKTPSFHVDPERGLFHCHGCNAGGDAFTYLQRTTGGSFRDVLAALAGPGDVEGDAGSRGPDVAAPARAAALDDIRERRGARLQLLDLARGDAYVRAAALRRDPEQRDDLTRDLAVQCEDAEAREAELHRELDDLDAEERALGGPLPAHVIYGQWCGRCGGPCVWRLDEGAVR